MTREEAIERFNGIINAMSISIAQSKFYPSKAELDELCNMAIEALSADAVSEDTQTEERARFVAKETELAHIEARLENAEKRLQGACVANFVVEQLERLKDMTDEERRDFLIRFFGPSADAVPIVYCMDCAKSEPLDEHGALWKCKAHDRTTLRHSYCSHGERREP